MSEPIRNGGPAFPRSGFLSEMDNEKANQYDNKPDKGMSLRDYFAAAVAGHVWVEMLKRNESGEIDYAEFVERTHNIPFEIADGMLAAREAKP